MMFFTGRREEKADKWERQDKGVFMKNSFLYSMKMNLFPLNLTSLFLLTVYNQSAENAGVTFVKGANERNEFF